MIPACRQSVLEPLPKVAGIHEQAAKQNANIRFTTAYTC